MNATIKSRKKRSRGDESHDLAGPAQKKLKSPADKLISSMSTKLPEPSYTSAPSSPKQKKLSFREHYKGPETEASHPTRKAWKKYPKLWKEDQILRQIFVESKESEDCVFGCFMKENGGNNFWFGVQLSYLDSDLKWRIVKSKYSTNISPAHKEMIERVETDRVFEKPSSFWTYFFGGLNSSRTGYENIKTIKAVTVETPEYMQALPFSAHKMWTIKEATPLGTILAIGILNELVKNNNQTQHVLDAIRSLNNLYTYRLATAAPVLEEEKRKSSEEKKVQNALLQKLRDQKKFTADKEVRVILPSNTLGKIDILITSPKKIIIELKVAKNWVQAIGQIKRYQQSELEKDRTLINDYKLVIYMVSCVENEYCIYLKEARDIWPNNDPKSNQCFHFTCIHEKIETWLED